ALARLGRPSADPKLSRREREAVAAENPLLHFLRIGAAADLDPDPLFSSGWYRERNGIPAGGAFADFLKPRWAPPSPSPVFDSDRCLGRHPWLRRRHVNPLQHHYLFRAPEPPEASDASRPASLWEAPEGQGPGDPHRR